MNEKVDVVLIHLNFNSLVRYGNLFHEALMSLIQSINYTLREGFRCAVVFVDNASSDETVSTIKSLVEKHAHFSWNILKLDKNYGFAKGNNKAYKFATKSYTFKYVVFVNPDVIFTTEWLANILKFIVINAEREKLGLIQPLTLPLSYRKTIDYKAFIRNKFSYVNILTGHVIFTDSRLFDNIGGWDETFFLYGEDVDLSLKVLSKKRRNVIYYGSVVFHEAHLSTLGVAVLPDIVSRSILLFRYAHTKGSLAKLLLLSSIYDFLRMSYRLYSWDNSTVYSTLYAWKILLKYLRSIYYQRKIFSVNAQLIRFNKVGEVEKYFLINIIENIRRKISEI